MTGQRNGIETRRLSMLDKYYGSTTISIEEEFCEVLPSLVLCDLTNRTALLADRDVIVIRFAWLPSCRPSLLPQKIPRSFHASCYTSVLAHSGESRISPLSLGLLPFFLFSLLSLIRGWDGVNGPHTGTHPLAIIP